MLHCTRQEEHQTPSHRGYIHNSIHARLHALLPAGPPLSSKLSLPATTVGLVHGLAQCQASSALAGATKACTYSDGLSISQLGLMAACMKRSCMASLSLVAMCVCIDIKHDTYIEGCQSHQANLLIESPPYKPAVHSLS